MPMRTSTSSFIDDAGNIDQLTVPRQDDLNKSAVPPNKVLTSQQIQALHMYRRADSPFLIYESNNKEEKLICTRMILESTSSFLNHVRQCRRVADTTCPEKV